MGARKGDCRRVDFVCEPCNFHRHTGRWPTTPGDFELCVYDRILTCDEFAKDAPSTALKYLGVLRAVARWGLEHGLPVLAGSAEELERMPDDHRQLGWYMVARSMGPRAVQFQSLRAMRSAIWNYYGRMPGVEGQRGPTASPAFAHRFDGLLQRMGCESKQDRVWPTRLLRSFLCLIASDYARAEGDRRVELALATFAMHLYFQAGFRANEAFYERTLTAAQGIVGRQQAAAVGVAPHFRWFCSTQTKTERHAQVQVWVAQETAGDCPLSAGKWLRTALQELDAVGRGPRAGDPSLWVFADVRNKRWSMGWFWATHVEPRLRQLQREGHGDLVLESDFDRIGSNSPRRTWNSMAAKHPDPVSADLRERHGRWREKEKRRQRGPSAMTALYEDPDLEQRLRATTFLSAVK